MLDLLIKNATVVDGTGAPAFRASVGIENGTIRKAEENSPAKEVIDAEGLHLSPGFVDIHSHGDMVLGTDYGIMCKLSQGITTEVAGQCGCSMFPIVPGHFGDAKDLLSVATKEYPDDMVNWASFGRYAQYVDGLKLGANVKILVGHGTLRIAAMGLDNREPTDAEMDKMKDMLREAMENGAMGLSSGLIYTPSCFAKPDELVELCKVIAPYGGIYATHMRNEAEGVVQSVEESIYVAKSAGVPLLISHHKVCGRQNWGLSAQTIKLIDEAVKDGMTVTADQYPYPASMTHLLVCLPPKYLAQGFEKLTEALKSPETRQQIKAEILDPATPFENQYLSCGGWEGVFIAYLPTTPEYSGMFVSEAAEKMGVDGFTAFFDLMVQNGCIGSGIYHCMGEEDMLRIIQADNTVVGSDGICKAMEEITHPRAWGTFPRAVSFFHKEKGALTLEQIIHKMTALPAQRAMLEGKGVIKDGFDADLVIFDYSKLQDMATFKQSNLKAEGIEYVIVNGQIVYQGKHTTGILPGKLIRHGGRGK